MTDSNMNTLTDFLKKTGEQTISLYVLDHLPLKGFLNTNGGTVEKHVKRGFLWYLSNETIEYVLTGTSNLDPNAFKVKVLVDDTLFNAVGSYVAEESGIGEMIQGNIQSVVGGQMANYVSSAMIVEAVNMVGKKYEDTIFKKLSNIIGIDL